MQTSTCARPSPKMSRRIDQSRRGSISRPMMKRKSTTPSSATWSIVSGSLDHAEAEGPHGEARREVAQDRAEARAAEQRHGDHGRAQERHGGGEVEPGRGFDGHGGSSWSRSAGT